MGQGGGLRHQSLCRFWALPWSGRVGFAYRQGTGIRHQLYIWVVPPSESAVPEGPRERTVTQCL